MADTEDRVRVVRFTLSWPPTGNHYKKYYCSKSSPRNPHPIRASLTAEAAAYKLNIATLAEEAGVAMLVGPVSLTVHLYRPRAVGDIDNSLKVLQDSLNGIAYSDDGMIRELHAFLHDDDKQHPRAEVTIEQLR